MAGEMFDVCNTKPSSVVVVLVLQPAAAARIEYRSSVVLVCV